MSTLTHAFSVRLFAILAGAIIMTQTTPSQGQVTFTSALRNVGVAAPNNGVPNTEIQSTALGDFNETLLRMPISGPTGQVGRVLASQQSRILSDRVEFALIGDTTQSNPNYTVQSNSLSASALFSCRFTLTEPTEYELSVAALSNTSLNGQQAITLMRENVPPDQVLVFQIVSSPMEPLRGLLQPGSYAFGGVAAAGSRAIGGNGIVGIAQVSATFTIPAPASLGVLVASAAVAISTRRRKDLA